MGQLFNSYVTNYQRVSGWWLSLPLWKIWVSWSCYSQLNWKIKFMFQTTNQWFNDIFNDSLKVWEGCHEKIPKRQMCDLMGQKSYVPQPEITLCHQLLPNGDHLTPPNSTPSDGTDPVPRWNIWSQDWMRNIAGKTQRKWVVKSIGWHDAGFFPNA